MGWGSKGWGGSGFGASPDTSVITVTPIVPGSPGDSPIPGDIQSPDESNEPIDFLLGQSGDLDLSQGLRFSTGLNAVAQGIRIRVLMFKGEWFLNLDTGLPYFEDILGQKYDELRVRSAFRTEILASPGVASIEDLEVEFERVTRTVKVSWKVTTTTNQTIEDSLPLPVGV